MNYIEATIYMNEARKKGSILGLENMKNLMDKLDNVQDKIKVLHIAGTNGKGSTSAYLSEILMEAGYKVGRYTSPAVFDYLEVFKINNQMMTEEEYGEILQEIKIKIDEMENEGKEIPTAFEIETAMAFLYFYKSNCDFAIIEVGMGGITDATNVLNNPFLSIITSISMDHMEFLGNTLTKIAEKKAGIIKKGCRVVSSAQEEEVLKVIREEAVNKKCELSIADNVKGVLSRDYTDICYKGTDGKEYYVTTSMLGSFQIQNVATAIEAAISLRKAGINISDENIRLGIKNTVWHGRFEKISERPDIYFDGGHNPGAAVNIRDTVEIYFTNRKIIYIIGVLADKDYDEVLKITASLASEIITVTPPDNIRALDGKILMETVKKYNENVTYADSLQEAVRQGKQAAGENGVVIIFGSLSYLGRIKRIL